MSFFVPLQSVFDLDLNPKLEIIKKKITLIVQMTQSANSLDAHINQSREYVLTKSPVSYSSHNMYIQKSTQLGSIDEHSMRSAQEPSV